MHDHSSSADDKCTAERTSKHFCQHVINHASMELEATQAAGVVLVRDDLREDHERFDVLYKEACRLVAAVERQHPEPLMAANEWGAFKERCGEIRQDMERKARNWGFRISAERRELEIRGFLV